MYVTTTTSKSSNGKSYTNQLLRESYREDGKVKNRTIANLTGYDKNTIEAVKLALKHKDNLQQLTNITNDIKLYEGKSIGAVWAMYQVAKRIGIEQALGTDFNGQLAIWMVLARVIEQGSRLSAVRMAQTHEFCDVLGMRRGFDENDLYDTLTWLDENQVDIEDKLFASRHKHKPGLFLYDVTSSFLEGEYNALAEYGYNRDKKRGKKQIVVGLLCAPDGEPVSIEVFKGNTSDVDTFESQVRKVSERFGCERITMVGDRGMIKSGQIKDLSEHGFTYITAITKPQIETLLQAGVIQLELFENDLCEVEHDGVRYILRRNPVRAKEMSTSRQQKLSAINKLVKQQNEYLQSHSKAGTDIAQNKVIARIDKLKISAWLTATNTERSIILNTDIEALKDIERLDVIKTDLQPSVADKQIVHDRYKDLILVEKAFRTCKTFHLELRPIYVHKAENTRGHALVTMLAYKIIRELNRCWHDFDLTIEEGIVQLATLCSIEIRVKGGGSCIQIPEPRPQSQELLKALAVTLPKVLPHKNVSVVTRKKLSKKAPAQ